MNERGISQILMMIVLVVAAVLPFYAFYQNIQVGSSSQSLVNVWKKGYEVVDTVYTLLGSPADTDYAEIHFNFEEWEIEIYRRRLNLTATMGSEEYSIGIELLLRNDIYWATDLNCDCNEPGKIGISKELSDDLKFCVECDAGNPICTCSGGIPCCPGAN